MSDLSDMIGSSLVILIKAFASLETQPTAVPVSSETRTVDVKPTVDFTSILERGSMNLKALRERRYLKGSNRFNPY